MKRPVRRWQPWALAGGFSLLGLCAVAAAVALNAACVLESEARQKLADMAARAGLDVEIGELIIEPWSPVGLRHVVVRDPADGRVLLDVRHVRTDLTLDSVRRGARRPGRVELDGVAVDLRDPERWQAAARRWKARAPESTASGAKRLPEILVTHAHIRALLPKGRGPVALEDVSARLVPPVEAGARWRVAATARVLGNALSLDALLDPAGGDHEAGMTFTPSVTVALDGLPTVTVDGAYARAGEGVRLRNVRIDDGEDTVTVTHVDVHAVPGGAATPESALEAVLSDVRGKRHATTFRAGRVAIDVVAGTLANPERRVRSVTAEDLTVDAPSALMAAAASTMTLTLDGVDLANPLAGVRHVSVAQPDVSWVLPPANKAKSIPYYREIQAFLLGDTGPVDGGGPTAPRVPEPQSLGKGLDALVAGMPVVEVTDGSLALVTDAGKAPAVVFDGLNATVKPGQAGHEFHVAGRLRETATGDSGTFSIEGSTIGDGRLRRAHVNVGGTKLAHHLGRFSDKIRLTPSSALSVDLEVTPHAQGPGITASGQIGLTDVGFFAPRIHGTAVDGLRATADLTVDYDPVEEKLVLDMPRILLSDKAVMRLAATVDKLSAKLPRLDVKLVLPRQDCGDVLASLPPALVPRLDGLVIAGQMEGYLTSKVDLMEPRGLELDVDLTMKDCRPTSYGSVDVERLDRRFTQEVVEKGEPIGVFVGPGTQHYRALHRIPKHVQMGALWTEDHSFFSHQGFRPTLIRRAIILDLEGGRYVYGGSTITQQLVKNLFLSREKTLSRKLEEAIIVWLLERRLTKRRILELYLNCIEYGAKLYGLENASRTYFGKPVEELTPLEGAFLMGLKPYPWSGWQQYKNGGVKDWWLKRLSKILYGLQRDGTISDADVEAAKPFRPVFVTSPSYGTEPAPPSGDEDAPPPPTANDKENE